MQVQHLLFAVTCQQLMPEAVMYTIPCHKATLALPKVKLPAAAVLPVAGMYCTGLQLLFLHAGMIEYWSGSDYAFPHDQVVFKMKLDTDLFALAKAKTTSKSLEISKDGSQFATFSTDRSRNCHLDHVRISLHFLRTSRLFVSGTQSIQ